MPYRLAAFADEISPDIQIQMDHLSETGVKFCALRGAFDKSVLDWEPFQVPLTKKQFHNRGIKFSCLGSPIGKVPLDGDFDQEMERFRATCKRAQEVETRVIRVFSFFIPEGGDRDAYREEVIARMKKMAAYAAGEGLNLLHENESGIYGDTADRCVDLLSEVQANNLMAAFDFANFIAVDEDPSAAWPKLKKWVKDFHIKDRTADGQITVAGRGEGGIAGILADALKSGWTGLLTVEPHLDRNPEYQELSGPQRYRAAIGALKDILKDLA